MKGWQHMTGAARSSIKTNHIVHGEQIINENLLASLLFNSFGRLQAILVHNLDMGRM
jgi:hypothetical protein